MVSKDQDAVNVIGNIIMPVIKKKMPVLTASQMAPMPDKTILHLGTAYLGGSKEGDWFTVGVVKPFKLAIRDERKGNDEHLNWCIRTFGESYNHLTDQCFWFERDGRFYFRKEEDRTLFILKWSE